MPSRLWNPWQLLRVPHPKLSDADQSEFDALLARTPEGGIVDYELAQPKWWFVHHHLRRGYLAHGSNEATIDEFRTRQTFDAHAVPMSPDRGHVSGAPITCSGPHCRGTAGVAPPELTSSLKMYQFGARYTQYPGGNSFCPR